MNATAHTDVRLGLVMYGGVSLAMYINGVAREFFEAVRGTQIYGLLQKATDSKITVDIISGTSAGGINGIFLAYALANNKDFSQLADLWRELADVSRLIRKPESGVADAASLLDSEGFYYPALVQAFRGMTRLPNQEDLNVRELDLFVTGTNLEGNIYTTFDDLGHAIDVKDHRTVFVLKHRKGRKEPFKPESPLYARPEIVYQSLSKLACITSCFPGAFSPVVVEDSGESRGASGSNVHNHEDECLRLWGSIDRKTVFLDGGVLDNKPFSYTIDAIYGRTADTAVERFLCYVEPDPESFKPDPKLAPPTFLGAIVKGGLSIGSYESIGDDLDSIQLHNSRTQRYKEACAALRGSFSRQVQSGRCSGVVPKLEANPDPCTVLYVHSRFSAIADRAVMGLLKEGGRRPFIRNPEMRKKAAQLIRSFQQWKGDGGATLLHYDVYFRLRRLFHVVYRISEDLYDGVGSPLAPPSEAKRRLWKALNRQIKVFETIRYWMEHVIDNLPVQWLDEQGEIRNPEEIWDEVTVAMRRLLVLEGIPARLGCENRSERLKDPEGAFVQAEITALHEELGRRWKRIEADFKNLREHVPPLDADLNFPGLLTWMDEVAAETFVSCGEICNPFRLEYEQFLCLDSVVYPLEAIADLAPKDTIRTVRFSPVDAQKGFSDRDLRQKLSGDALGHFAGFFKRSWRSNDILWGRLDAVCQLTELLFSQDRMRVITNRDFQRQTIRGTLGIDAQGSHGLRKELVKSFPHAGDKALDQIAKWLEEIFAEDERVRGSWMTPDAAEKWNAHLTLLISIAQFEILKTDLEGVVNDAIVEQSAWNLFRKAPDANPESALLVLEKYSKSGTAAAGPALARELASVLGPDEKLVHEFYKKWPPARAQAEDIQLKIVSEGIRAALPEYDAKRSAFVVGDGKADPLVMTVASQHYAKYSLRNLEEDPHQQDEPLHTKLGRFFTTYYRVGSESLVAHIPKPILLETFCRAILVLRRCLVSSPAKDSKVLKMAVDVPARFLIAISRMLREDAPTVIAVKSSLTVLLAAAIFTGFVFWDPIIYHSGEFSLKWAVGLLLLPPVGLYLLWARNMERILGVAAAVGGGVFLALALVRAPWRPGLEIPSVALQLANEVARVEQIIRTSGASLQRDLLLDSYFVVPAYFLVFFGFGLWTLARSAGRSRWVGVAMCGTACGAAAADLIENSLTSALLESVTQATVRDVYWAAVVKWALLSAMLVCAAAAAAYFAWTKRRQSNKRPLFSAVFASLLGFAAALLMIIGIAQGLAWVEWALAAMAGTVIMIGLTVSFLNGGNRKSGRSAL